MSEITELLHAMSTGQPTAGDRLFTLLYPDLRAIAHRRVQRSGHSAPVQTTELVHEAYLRLIGAENIAAVNRAHFLNYAARVMRSVIVDLVRQRIAERRGGGAIMLGLDCDAVAALPAGEDEVLRIDDALKDLEKIDERLAKIVEMRYFAGMTGEDIAAHLGISIRSLTREWTRARMLLAAALQTT
jgi:RNA polymerase sigma factor (TIGR02999 family)